MIIKRVFIDTHTLQYGMVYTIVHIIQNIFKILSQNETNKKKKEIRQTLLYAIIKPDIRRFMRL